MNRFHRRTINIGKYPNKCLEKLQQNDQMAFSPNRLLVNIKMFANHSIGEGVGKQVVIHCWEKCKAAHPI